MQVTCQHPSTNHRRPPPCMHPCTHTSIHPCIRAPLHLCIHLPACPRTQLAGCLPASLAACHIITSHSMATWRQHHHYQTAWRQTSSLKSPCPVTGISGVDSIPQHLRFDRGLFEQMSLGTSPEKVVLIASPTAGAWRSFGRTRSIGSSKCPPT